MKTQVQVSGTWLCHPPALAGAEAQWGGGISRAGSPGGDGFPLPEPPPSPLQKGGQSRGGGFEPRSRGLCRAKAWRPNTARGPPGKGAQVTPLQPPPRAHLEDPQAPQQLLFSPPRRIPVLLSSTCPSVDGRTTPHRHLPPPSCPGSDTKD